MGFFKPLEPHHWLGCASILVDFIGLGMIAPILPGIVSSQSVGDILTAQYLAVVVGQVAVAALSDVIGRRRVIAIVMLLDALLFGATGFTKDVSALVALRLLAGFAAPVALGISYVAEVSAGLPAEEANRNFAHVGVAFSLGTLVGAATGGLLGPDSWLPANLVAGAVPCFVALTALLMRDTDADAKRRQRSAGVKDAEAQHVEQPAEQGGMKELLATPEMLSLLLSYVANGFFQGGFFSLMPVLLADCSEGLVRSEAAIAAVIMLAAVLQVCSNVWGVPASLRQLGSHGHCACCGFACALLLAAAAFLKDLLKAGTPLALLLTGALYAFAFVPSASTLSALNQSVTIYARRHGAPLGLATALGRCLFATAFGVAPAASIRLYEATGGKVWPPLAVMAVLAGCAGTAFAMLKLRRAGGDAIPPVVSKQAAADTALEG